MSSQECGTSSKGFADAFDDVACLEETVFGGVASGVPLQALDQDDRWNDRRPKAFTLKCENQRGCGPRTLREPGDRTRVEHQHEYQPALRCDRFAIRLATVLARERSVAVGCPTSDNRPTRYRSVSARRS